MNQLKTAHAACAAGDHEDAAKALIDYAERQADNPDADLPDADPEFEALYERILEALG